MISRASKNPYTALHRLHTGASWVFVRSQTPGKGTVVGWLIRTFSSYGEFDWARLEEECGQPRRKLS